MEERQLADLCIGVQHIGIPTVAYTGTMQFYRKLGFKIIEEEIKFLPFWEYEI